MSELRITTNHVPRPVIDAWELTATERGEFDYLDWDGISEGRDSASFVRYRGELYDLGEFEVWTNPESPMREGWDGFRSDSFFSGLVIRWCDDYESVVVGRYTS